MPDAALLAGGGGHEREEEVVVVSPERLGVLNMIEVFLEVTFSSPSPLQDIVVATLIGMT